MDAESSFRVCQRFHFLNESERGAPEYWRATITEIKREQWTLLWSCQLGESKQYRTEIFCAEPRQKLCLISRLCARMRAHCYSGSVNRLFSTTAQNVLAGCTALLYQNRLSWTHSGDDVVHQLIVESRVCRRQQFRFFPEILLRSCVE